jgi:hypothetical protein
MVFFGRKKENSGANTDKNREPAAHQIGKKSGPDWSVEQKPEFGPDWSKEQKPRIKIMVRTACHNTSLRPAGLHGFQMVYKA